MTNNIYILEEYLFCIFLNTFNITKNIILLQIIICIYFFNYYIQFPEKYSGRKYYAMYFIFTVIYELIYLFLNIIYIASI